MRDLTVVARAKYYVMWEELSVDHFQNLAITGKGTKIFFKGKRVLWFLFSNQFSD